MTLCFHTDLANPLRKVAGDLMRAAGVGGAGPSGARSDSSSSRLSASMLPSDSWSPMQLSRPASVEISGMAQRWDG